MPAIRPHLSWLHGGIFGFLLLVFTLWNYAITNAGLSPGPDRQLRIVQTTLGTITGPMTGAISRGFQECCTRASLSVMRVCGPALLFSILFQFLGPPGSTLWVVLRLSVWTLGWLVWFLGGIFSFAHALG